MPSANKTKYQKSTKLLIARTELVNAPYNPRTINRIAAKRLKGSIQSHGLVGGIVWNRRTGHIVGGHQRLNQLDELEGTSEYTLEVDVIDVDLDEEKELNIALNNRTMQGEFDNDKLAGVIQDLVEARRNIERTGFTMHDCQEMIGDIMLAGEAAVQRDTEASVFAELDELKALAKEYRAPEGLPSDTDGQEPTMVVPTPPLPRQDDYSNNPPIEKPESSSPEALAKRRVDYVSETEGEVDADTMITLTFNTNAQRAKFQRLMKLESTKRYFDRYEIEVAFGVDLGDG